MIRYKVDEKRLKDAVSSRGFPNLFQFSKSCRLNRMTLQHYLRGKGPFSESYYQVCRALQVDPLDLLAPFKAESPEIGEVSDIVKSLVRESQDLAVALFGSRARGNAKRYSDWDLGVTMGAEGLSSSDYLRMKVLVDDLADDLPRMVDLINLDQAPDWFLKEINYRPIFLGGNESNWNYFLGVLNGSQRAKRQS